MKTVNVFISDSHAMLKGNGRYFNPCDSRMAIIIENRVQSATTIEYNGRKENLKSGMGIFHLCIKDNSYVTINVEGKNEDSDVIKVLDALIDAKAISQEEYRKHIDILNKEKVKQKQTSQKPSNSTNEKTDNTNKSERLEIKVDVNDAYGLVDNGGKHVALGNSYFSRAIENQVTDCRVWIRNKNQTADAKSSIGVLSLAIQDGDEIWFVIEGENRYSALATVLDICKRMNIIKIPI